VHVCWLDIKDKFKKQSGGKRGGGLLSFLSKFNNVQGLGSITRIQYLINNRNVDFETDDKALLPFVLVLSNDTIMYDILEKANQFISDDGTNKEFCKLKKFKDFHVKEQISSDRTVASSMANQQEQITSDDNQQEPNSNEADSITKLTFDENIAKSLRNCIFMLIVSRLVHNHAFVIDQMLKPSPVAPVTDDQQVPIDDKQMDVLQKYLYTLSAGEGLKMVPADAFELLRELKMYQDIFQKNMAALANTPASQFNDLQGKTPNDIIRFQCFREQKPVGIFARMFAKKGGGSKVKKHEDMIRVCNMYNQQRMQSICEHYIDKRTKQPKTMCYKHIESYPSHMSCYDVLLLRMKKAKKPVVKPTLKKRK
jgi:hypothetical protein